MLEPPAPIGVDQALQQVRAACAERSLPAQRIALTDALGRTLAQVMRKRDQLSEFVRCTVSIDGNGGDQP